MDMRPPPPPIRTRRSRRGLAFALLALAFVLAVAALGLAASIDNFSGRAGARLARGWTHLADKALAPFIYADSDSFATLPGTPATPHPTLNNISVEWPIKGDANRNGKVRVRFRAVGERDWREAMPLRRVPGGAYQGFRWRNRHAGSIFDLHAGTIYDIELTLADPDGGSMQTVLRTATRAMPEPATGASVIRAGPAEFADALDRARAGDIVELAPGRYPGFAIGHDGEPGRPLVVRGQAGAVVEGIVSLADRAYVMLDGLTVHGSIKIDGSRQAAIVRCTVQAAAGIAEGDGITTHRRAEDAYIADNTVTGSTEWVEAALGAEGRNLGEGILVTGPGHVIAHNRVSRFRDAISLAEDEDVVDQFSIDIVGNDISEAADDAIELDFCFHGCRVLRNRITNVFTGVSAQPTLGGPAYFLRNVMFNTAYVPFKLHRNSTGDVLLHNTVVKAGDAWGIYTDDQLHRTYSRNNLFLGGPGTSLNGYGNGSGRVIDIRAADPGTTDLDFDAFGSTAGGFKGRIGQQDFDGLAQLQATGQETHGVEIDIGVFAAPVQLPADPMAPHAVADLRLKPGSEPENIAQRIPNINDNFNGDGPDMGALEVGVPLPIYGPRPAVDLGSGKRASEHVHGRQ